MVLFFVVACLFCVFVSLLDVLFVIVGCCRFVCVLFCFFFLCVSCLFVLLWFGVVCVVERLFCGRLFACFDRCYCLVVVPFSSLVL